MAQPGKSLSFPRRVMRRISNPRSIEALGHCRLLTRAKIRRALLPYLLSLMRQAHFWLHDGHLRSCTGGG
jgi:hypothetical protein